MTQQHIDIKPSAALAVALCVAHAAAIGVIWLAPVPVWVSAVVTLAIAVSLIHALAREAALQSAGAIVALEITELGRIAFKTRGGEWQDCELLGSSYVSPWLTILNLKSRGARVRHVVLVPGNIEPQQFRRLRTWLRWAAASTGNREVGRSGDRQS